MENKNIWTVPTEEKSRIQLSKTNKLTVFEFARNCINCTKLNMYITSEDRVKDCYAINTRTLEVVFIRVNGGFHSIIKKIILTTDPALIKQGIQEISSSLIEYCMDNTVDYVSKEKIMRLTEQPESKCTCERPYDNVCDYCEEQESKHILSEAKKRAEYLDTLENASEKYVGYGMELYDGNDHVKYDAFIAGAKWQFEQELNIASGYLNANLENIEKMKNLHTDNDMIRFAEYSVAKALGYTNFKLNDEELTKFKSL